MKLNVKTDTDKEVISIFDIDVPIQLKNKISTGLEYFDTAIGGQGFTPSMVTLFTGTPGAGKTTMMLELANSMTGNGCNVLFNTAEESLYQLKMTVERLKLRHGFKAGQETDINKLLANSKSMMEQEPDKPFFLIIDSLQCLTEGTGPGNHTAASTQRCLQKITDFCKENYCNAIVIGQVTKNGNMAGRNVLKHMVDSMMSLSVEEKDEDLMGCRILRVNKNRFGGAGHIMILTLKQHGFSEISRISFG
jgi:DNA repair protein RadA/Sms